MTSQSPKLSKLIDLRNKLQSHSDLSSKLDKKSSTKFECGKCGKSFSTEGLMRTHTIQELENEIAEIEAEENRDIVMKNFKRLSENPENVNIKEVWKILRNIFPKFKTPIPIAKRNYKGELITDLQQIKYLLLKEYSQRLRMRPVRPDLGDLKLR